MYLKFKILTLELTRRCNMQCRHCMRGEAQDVDVGYDVLQSLFRQTGYIGHLTLTGGEPSLVPGTILDIISVAREHSCVIDSFFCATNAKVYSEDFVTAMDKLYVYCQDKEDCVLTVTTDQFHGQQSFDAIQKYQQLCYYRPVGERSRIKDSAVINRGRAKETGVGQFDIPVQKQIYDASVSAWHIEIGERIYVSALGEIITDSDLSYDTQEKHSIGNIKSENAVGVFMRCFDSGKDEPEGYLYNVSFFAQADTMDREQLNHDEYYKAYTKAAPAYQSLITNLHMNPCIDKTREVKVQMEELPVPDKSGLVKHAVFHYFDLEDKKLGSVIVAFGRIKLEDSV